MSDSMKSCANCPSFLSAQEAASYFQKSIGVPVCARFGNPLALIDSTETQDRNLQHRLASNCSAYGESKPPVVNWDKARFQVMLPDPEALGRNRSAESQQIRSCLQCRNFVKEETVVNELGWASGLCSAQGRLILSNRYTIEARNCDYREMGTPRTDIYGMSFLDAYESGLFEGEADPVREHREAQEKFVDPIEYETDHEVSNEDAERGIRAWRKVIDPNTKNAVYLPIYRIDFFSEDEQKKIPRTGDDEHPEDYIDHFFGTYKAAVLWTALDETPALWGQAGTGKTELFRHMAWLMCLPFERFSITGSTELDDLAGKMHFTEGQGTHFEYGRLPKAWTKPSVIVIDEPNTGPNEVWQFLRPLTDNSKQLVLDMNAGEQLNRHNECYLGMAMNPAWDYKNIGANQIGDADANRLMHIYVELPPPQLEREIIKTRCEHDDWNISDQQLDMVMNIAGDIRALIDEGGLTLSWAIRPQIKVARALRWFDAITAYKMASSDYLEPEQAKQVIDVVKTYVVSDYKSF